MSNLGALPAIVFFSCKSTYANFTEDLRMTWGLQCCIFFSLFSVSLPKEAISNSLTYVFRRHTSLLNSQPRIMQF